MAGSVSRAARALRDPWSLVVAGVGAGSAWAIGLPVGAVGLVGAGMLGVAAVVGVVRGRSDDRDSAEPAPPPLRPGTVQANLVGTLHGYRVDLEQLQQSPTRRRPSRSSAVQAVEAARSAESVANRVARAVDAVDDAVGRADGRRPANGRSGEVRASVQRMKQHRRDLLTGLTTAVDEVGEVYAKLLELSTTARPSRHAHGRVHRSHPGQPFAGRHPRSVRRPRRIGSVGPQRQPPRPSMTTNQSSRTHPVPA